VLRENTQRRIVVSSNVADRDLGSVVTEMQQRIGAQVQLPEGYFIEYGGQFEAQRESTRTLSLLTIFSLIAIFFLLIKALGDWRSALQVMINIPLALIGAIFILTLSVSAAFGAPPSGSTDDDPRGQSIAAFVHALVLGDESPDEELQEEQDEDEELDDEADEDLEEDTEEDTEDQLEEGENHGACVREVAQDKDAVGGRNDNHGGAVSEAAHECGGDEADEEATEDETVAGEDEEATSDDEADADALAAKAERQAAREAARAERQAAKAERRAERDAARAEQQAQHANREQGGGNGNGNGHGKGGGKP